MSGNATATVLTQDVWTKVEGVTVAGILERFSMASSNNLIYTGKDRSTLVTVMASISVFGSVNNQVVQLAIFKNGVKETPAMQTTLSGNVDRADNLALSTLANIAAAGEGIEIYIRCTSGSNNVAVDALHLVVAG